MPDYTFEQLDIGDLVTMHLKVTPQYTIKETVIGKTATEIDLGAGLKNTFDVMNDRYIITDVKPANP